MATRAYRPARTLIIFAIVIAFLYAAVALEGSWKPKLGLDLQGGTRITLAASTETGEAITPEKLQEARGIIDQRVNGSGVAEAAVTTQGDRNIVVEIPGQDSTNLVDTVKQTAQLRFRLVAAMAQGAPAKQPEATASGTPAPKGRALSEGLVRADDPSDEPTQKPSAGPTPDATPAPTASPTPPAAAADEGAPVDQPLQWMDNPGKQWLQKFGDYTCPTEDQPGSRVIDRPDEPLITCDDDGFKYLLSQAVIEGTELTKSQAGIPQNEIQYVVDLTFNSHARKIFADVTATIANATSPITGQQKQFAIVLDGKVISAPTVESPIPNGQAQISGNFTQASAESLANSLRYGALPLKFTAPVVTEEGPSLAADQLSAGISAGIIGLILVLVYCLLYYRGLGLVVFASLMVAAALTYVVVLAMSSAIGFTLTLPGIAGLIIGVGITADSFIVYFERIRDEMRDGKSMRVAVEAGWVRARATCLAADAVSLLAAVVLYIFAIGVVRGFAFTLGVSTVIDVVVFFFFTKPMVSLLAQRPFFNTGHKLSGLDAENLGIDRLPGVRAPRTSGGHA